MRHSRLPLTLALALLLVAAPQARSPKPGSPESVGMSSQRLGRIKMSMQAMIDSKEMAGVETLVARRGILVHHERTGVADGALFGIASMTKPVTSVAIMMLLEEGKLLLSDPVSRFIPSFRDMRVLSADGPSTDGDAVSTVPARRPITIDDLLTHTSGLVYGISVG